MRRYLVRFCLIVGALFVLACLGQAVPFHLALVLLLGWIHYLYRVLPQIQIDASALTTALVCLVLVTAGLHQFASWLYALMPLSPGADQTFPTRRWPARWTGWLIGGVLLMFVAGIASVGITHQVGWILLSGQAIVNSGAGVVWRAQSTNNLKQIGMALVNYQEEHGSYPPAGRFDPLGRPLHGWQAMILPFLERADLYHKIDLQYPWNDVRNVEAYRTRMNLYLQPGIDRDEDAIGYALSHYAGNALMLGGSVSRTHQSVSDGESNTIMAGGVVRNFKPWGEPTNWRDPALGINRSPYGFGSPYPGGANFLFVDGSVHFLKNTIDPRVLKALSTPAGGETVSSDEY